MTFVRIVAPTREEDNRARERIPAGQKHRRRPFFTLSYIENNPRIRRSMHAARPWKGRAYPAKPLRGFTEYGVSRRLGPAAGAGVGMA